MDEIFKKRYPLGRLLLRCVQKLLQTPRVVGL